MIRADADRRDLQSAVERSDVQVYNNDTEQEVRTAYKGAQFAQEQDGRGGDGRRPHEDSSGKKTEAEARHEFREKEERILRTLPRLATIQTHPGRKTERWIQEYTVDMRMLAHPDDWVRFVDGDEDMPLSKVRGSRAVFSIPPFKGWVQNWDDASELQEGILIHVPRDDSTCVRINDVVLAKNKVAQQTAMRAELEGHGAAVVPRLRLVTMISDKCVLPTMKINVPEEHVSTGHTHGDLPQKRSSQGDDSTSKKMEAASLHAACKAMLSNENQVHKLLVGICGYTDEYIQEVSDFDNIKRGGAMYTEPMTEVYGPSDSCTADCPAYCTDHRKRSLIGYCRQCDQPLVAVAQKIQLDAGPFGKGSPFSETSCLMKRVCRQSKFCPGSDRDANEVECENITKGRSYHLPGQRDSRFPSQHGVFFHDVLVDIMVTYVKSRIVVDEYCIAFRRAILLRYVNLRNQERFRMERSRLVVTRNDLEEMQDRLARSDTYAAAERDGDESVREQLSRRGDFQGTPAQDRKRGAGEHATTNNKRARDRGTVTMQQLSGRPSRY